MKLTVQILTAAAGFAFAVAAGSGAALAQADPSMPAVQTLQPAQELAPAYVAPAPAYASQPSMLGAMPGTTAADRDGDGIVDGYYSSDGMYHPNVAPAPMSAPNLVSRRGERG